jgi:hypothetical protein
VHQVGIGRKACEQTALGTNRIAGGLWILRKISAIHQGQQVSMHRSLGDADAIRDLGNSQFLGRKRYRFKHVERELHGADAGFPTIYRHDQLPRFVRYRDT